MRLKNVFTGLALIAVITTSVLSICSIQHTSAVMDHGMQGDTMLVSGFDSACPLAGVVDFQMNEKYSKADPLVFWQSINPIGMEHLVSLRLIPVDQGADIINHNQKNRSEIPISITSPPLAFAFSQGILHPKKDSVA
jgi:hypothetical protein